MRQCFEGQFSARDGESLFYRHWPAASPEPQGAIVLLHRGHEHSARMAHLVDELALPAFSLFAFDARGHGRSPGARGDSPSVGASVADIQSFVDHLRDAHGFDPDRTAVVAQSLSAVLAAAWAHDYAPKVRALVLAAPAFRIKLYVPFARFLLAAAVKLRGNFFVKSYVKGRHLTRDAERIAQYDTDPLIARAISVRVLLGLDALARRIVADAAAIAVPTQVLIAGKDLVVHAKPQQTFYERLGCAAKSREVFPELRHDILGELDRAPVASAIRTFLLERFSAPLEGRSLADAGETPFTTVEAARIAQQLPVLSPQALYWRCVRAALAVGGRLANGIAIGRRTGFDSGASLDYVYRNEASGRGGVGRAVDRLYLDAVGWRGIRTRKANLEAVIREAAVALRAGGRPVRILDIAAGGGRYVVDALAAVPRPERVELRDHSSANVAAGRALLAERGWADIATYRQGDAFEARGGHEGDLKQRGAFTLAIVSGLYELYADNDRVRRSLAQVAAELAPGGFLVYTGQPWHPQLQFIGRALTRERDGAPWVMRRRPQAELDALVENAGFAKIAQRIDEDGIFTVSVARRVALSSAEAA